jgi:hypothetical protein
MPPYTPDFQRNVILFAGLLVGGLVYAPSGDALKPPARYDQMATQRRMKTLKAAHDRSSDFAERLEQSTQYFLQTPYVLSPLGEAKGQDPDPRFRIDAFDCTTFVETAIAISYSFDWSKAADILDRIRYDNEKRRFQDRRHFITAAWLPTLQQEHYLEDITNEIGKSHVEDLVLHLTKKRWKRRRIAKDLILPPHKIPYGQHSLAIIPLHSFAKETFTIPSGTLINVVRIPVSSAPIIVTHQGLYFVDGKGRAWVRHASPVAKRVIDEPFSNMLRRYNKPRKWPMAGFNFQKIHPPEHQDTARNHHK